MSRQILCNLPSSDVLLLDCCFDGETFVVKENDMEKSMKIALCGAGLVLLLARGSAGAAAARSGRLTNESMVLWH